MKIISYIPDKYKSFLREKAISRTETRILLAGKKVTDFTPDELEVIVREEEEKIKGSIKEKGLLAVLALLGLNFFG